jgi:hypothetical protein
MGEGKTSRINTAMGGAIVKLPKGQYRKVAQNHWGLTDKQMKGMHVHHRIPRSQGGTNDPSNLYVCSSWFHANVWHDQDYFTQQAAEGGRKGGNSVSDKQRRINREVGRKNGKLPNSDLQKETVRQLGIKRKESGDLAVWWETSHKKMSKPVLLTLIETGDTFEFNSLADAARGLNLVRGEIRRCCQGKRKTTKGYKASYIK